jgi:hypothetical protein
MTKKNREPVTREELEEQNGEELPDREVMSIVPILDPVDPPLDPMIAPTPEPPEE